MSNRQPNRYLEKIAELQGLEKEAFRLPLRKPFKFKNTSTFGLKTRAFSKGPVKKSVLVKQSAAISPAKLALLKGWRGVKGLASGASDISGKVVDQVTGKGVYDAIKQNTKVQVEKFPGAMTAHSVTTKVPSKNPWNTVYGGKTVTQQTPYPPGHVGRYIESVPRPKDELKKVHEMPDEQTVAWVNKHHGTAAAKEVQKAINRRKVARGVAVGAAGYGGYKYLQGKAEEARQRQAYNQLYGTNY